MVLPVHPGMWPDLTIPISQPWFGRECDVRFERLRITGVERVSLPWFGSYRFAVYAHHPDPSVAITFVYLSSFNPLDDDGTQFAS
jgi:hypothetical protein